ncbi:MAG: carboxypeptidase-like regulatory domain-containing protein [Planctomycetota bacterium]
MTLLALYMSFAGCGNESGDRPDLGLVKGTVTFEGAPLAKASITFMPDSGRPASATTDAAGQYELIYIRNTPGCKVGHNKVLITSVKEGDNEMETEGDEPTAEAGVAKEKLPPKFNTETELEANVKEGENTFDFDLKK